MMIMMMMMILANESGRIKIEMADNALLKNV